MLIYNPTAHQGRSGKDFAKLKGLMGKANFKVWPTKRKDHAIELAKKAALSKKFDVIVACGGDGTICEVITGIMQAKEEKDVDPALGVVHIGTSPDFNRYHELPKDLESAAKILRGKKKGRIDVCRIEHLDMEKEPTVSYFGSTTNIGLGPSIASKSNGRYREYLGDFGGTFLSTLVSLAQYKIVDVILLIDGKKQRRKDLINMTIGKDPYIASGMRVPIVIEPDDGRMYCLSICSRSKLAILPQQWKMYWGNILDYKGAKLVKCKKVQIIGRFDPKVEFDGDFRGYLPATVEVLPRALEVMGVG